MAVAAVGGVALKIGRSSVVHRTAHKERVRSVVAARETAKMSAKEKRRPSLGNSDAMGAREGEGRRKRGVHTSARRAEAGEEGAA